MKNAPPLAPPASTPALGRTPKPGAVIPPWTRLDCTECGMESEATRIEPGRHPFVCSNCKLHARAYAAGEAAAALTPDDCEAIREAIALLAFQALKDDGARSCSVRLVALLERLGVRHG